MQGEATVDKATIAAMLKAAEDSDYPRRSVGQELVSDVRWEDPFPPLPVLLQ